MTFGITILSIMTFGIVTLSKMTLIIMTFGIMTLGITIKNATLSTNSINVIIAVTVIV